LDYNATTPIDPEVAEAIQPYLLEFFGNPSSSHWYGAQTKKAIESARSQVADLLDCQPDEIIFTSGGSESNNYALKGIAFSNRIKGNHIITSSIEHPAVTEVCCYLETQNFRVTYLPVDQYGLVDPIELEEAMTPRTILISLMHANNEVGTIQPISDISALAKQRVLLFIQTRHNRWGKYPRVWMTLGLISFPLQATSSMHPKGLVLFSSGKELTLRN
jgi:cysteine desulfurase